MKRNNIKKLKKRDLVIILLLTLGVLYLWIAFLILRGSVEKRVSISSENPAKIKEQIKEIIESGKITIAIDPGHGGIDPGKVGVNGANEKDINLQISMKLRDILTSNGINVLMTRTSDEGLYTSEDTKKKSADLRNRVNLVNESDAILVVSIHQNSYTHESSKGAQVFYHKQSDVSKDLAKIMQNEFILSVDSTNKRVEKSNESYYLLKKTTKPAVIVECGFLSNWEEADKMINEEHQKVVAKAINDSILKWMNNIASEDNTDKNAPQSAKLQGALMDNYSFPFQQ